MIDCAAWRWPNLAELETAAGVACSVVTLASAICAITPTPPPGSRWAGLYRLIEIAGLVVGHAKETGIAPPAPAAVDEFTRRAQDFLKTLGKSGLAVLLLAALAGSAAAPPRPIAATAAPVAPVAIPPAPVDPRLAKLLDAIISDAFARTSTFTFERDAAGRLVTRPLTPALTPAR